MVNVEKPKISPNKNQISNVQVFDANTNETISLSSIDLDFSFLLINL